jgi:IS30 family transposase
VSKAQQDIRRKIRALEHAARTGNIRQTCRYFGILRSLFYLWRAAYQQEGEAGPVNKKPCARSHPKTTAPAIVDEILHSRRTYHLGPIRIVWYLERYHDIRVCDATVYRTLKRHGMNRLPNRVGRRDTHRYEKQVPGHHVQVDVKFLTFRAKHGQRIRRYQYTAIDDATRVRALQVYRRHTQQNAIAFVDHVIQKFPFRIHTVRTDRGHEFQALFHWHLADQGIRHVYIRYREERHRNTTARLIVTLGRAQQHPAGRAFAVTSGPV